MSDDDDNSFFLVILPVTIVLFVSLISYLFVNYVKLKKHLLNSGQVLPAVPFLIVNTEQQPEIRSPDGQLPPPAYNTLPDSVTNNNNANNNGNNSSNNNSSRNNNRRQALEPIVVENFERRGIPAVVPAECPPPIYSIENNLQTCSENANVAISRRDRKYLRTGEELPLTEISLPPPYSSTITID